MNEEEKKAIEEAKRQIKDVHNYKELNCFMTDSTTLKTLLNLIEKLQKENELKDKVIEEIKEEVINHTSFENYLKRQGTEPDLFNQGRFYVADNIKEILNKVKGE